jgi:hypothetical protein
MPELSVLIVKFQHFVHIIIIDYHKHVQALLQFIYDRRSIIMKNSFLLLFSLLLLLLLCGCTNDKMNENPVPVTQNQNQPVNKAPVPVTTEPVPADKTENSSNSAAAGTANTKANTLSWYFVHNNQHQYPDTNADYKEMLARNHAIYIIPNESQKVF